MNRILGQVVYPPTAPEVFGSGAVSDERIAEAVKEYIVENPDIAGEDGKSAYDIAVEQGFEGSEELWLESLKGQQGESGVYMGETEPTDSNIKVWIKSSEKDPASVYVKKTQTIADIPLEDNISTTQLKEALQVPDVSGLQTSMKNMQTSMETLYTKASSMQTSLANLDANKATVVKGNITSDNNAWHTSGSYKLTGNYIIIEDTCFLHVEIPTISGWKYVYYSLPKRASATTLSGVQVWYDKNHGDQSDPGQGTLYTIQIGYRDNLSVFAIYRADGQNMDGSRVKATLVYKCENKEST
jgi:hypothetical protein